MATVRVEDREGGVRVLTLNRAEKKNALSAELVTALVDAFHDAERDRDVRVVVLTGAGDAADAKSAFCAGGDLSGPLGDGFLEQHKDRGAYAELCSRCDVAASRSSAP